MAENGRTTRVIPRDNKILADFMALLYEGNMNYKSIPMTRNEENLKEKYLQDISQGRVDLIIDGVIEMSSDCIVISGANLDSSPYPPQIIKTNGVIEQAIISTGYRNNRLKMNIRFLASDERGNKFYPFAINGSLVVPEDTLNVFESNRFKAIEKNHDFLVTVAMNRLSSFELDGWYKKAAVDLGMSVEDFSRYINL